MGGGTGMSVNTELQALLTKMGGSPSEEDSNSDLIKKISNAYEGGSSGSGITIVHGTVNEETEDTTLDMKAGELYELCESGAVIVRIGTSTDILKEYGHTVVGYSFEIRDIVFSASTADDYPTASGSK